MGHGGGPIIGLWPLTSKLAYRRWRKAHLRCSKSRNFGKLTSLHNGGPATVLPLI